MKKNLTAIDRKYVWHPFTQHLEWEKDTGRSAASAVITKGKGVYLYDDRGRKYIDGVSSLWANLHGHAHPQIDRAVRGQLKKVAHTTFLGLTHEPGIRLAQELVQAAPKGLSRVFYSDNGSTAVEVALKMAYQFHRNQHPESKKVEFLAVKNSYHGDTIGAVSVGGIDLFHKKFRPLLFKTHFAFSPHCRTCPHQKIRKPQPELQTYAAPERKAAPGIYRKETGCAWECLADAEKILKNNHSKIAAAVIEPVMQGAGGMLLAPPGYLKGFAALCQKYQVPWIADEVAVGFYRTGKLFACDQEGVRPDFLCLSKGISGGYLPLAATLTTEKIYRAFLGKYEDFKTFFHGHTYTANPLACAAARASLSLLKNQKTGVRIRRLAVLFEKLLGEILPLPLVGHIRQAGLMAGIELVQNKSTMEPLPLSFRLGKKVCARAREFGVLLRPLGDVIVLMPPLSIREHELRSLVQAVKKSILSVSRGLTQNARNN